MITKENVLQFFDKRLHDEDYSALHEIVNIGDFKTAQEDIYATCLFMDIRQFTKIVSSGLQPEEMRNLYSRLKEKLIEHHGFFDKVLGDAMMCEFGAPIRCEPDVHAVNACEYAFDITRIAKQSSLAGHPVRIGIGIHTGTMTFGNFITDDIFNYTSMGDNVNAAAKTETLSNIYQCDIMITEDTYRYIRNAYHTRYIDTQIFKTANPKLINDWNFYELIAKRGELQDIEIRRLEKHNEAVTRFRENKPEEGLSLLKKYLREYPEDRTAMIQFRRFRSKYFEETVIHEFGAIDQIDRLIECLNQRIKPLFQGIEFGFIVWDYEKLHYRFADFEGLIRSDKLVFTNDNPLLTKLKSLRECYPLELLKTIHPETAENLIGLGADFIVPIHSQGNTVGFLIADIEQSDLDDETVTAMRITLSGGTKRHRSATRDGSPIDSDADLLERISSNLDEVMLRIRWKRETEQMRNQLTDAERIGILNNELETRSAELEKTLNLLKEEQRQLKMRHQEMINDLLMARKIQMEMIPKAGPRAGISFYYQPMELVGGDFFDFVNISPTRIGLFLSDVSGHGIAAAFITTMIKSAVHNSPHIADNPAGVLSDLNQTLFRQTGGNFITAFYGILDWEDHSVTWANAGHNSPYLIDAGQAGYLFNQQKGFPLTVLNNDEMDSMGRPYRNQTRRLDTRSKLFLYTDGLVEAVNLQQKAVDPFAELPDFESSKLPALLVNHYRSDSQSLVDIVSEELYRFRGASQFDDDVCIICVDWSDNQ